MPVFMPKTLLFRLGSHFNDMEVTSIQNYAIQARVAAVLCATVFDRVFAGIGFAETDGPLLYVCVRDEQAAAEIEDDFAFS